MAKTITISIDDSERELTVECNKSGHGYLEFKADVTSRSIAIYVTGPCPDCVAEARG